MSIRVNFVDREYDRAESHPHRGRFVRKGTRVGTAISVKSAVFEALKTLRNMPGASRKAAVTQTTPHEVHDEACCPLCAAGELCNAKHGDTRDAGWDESQHPRGEGEHGGEFIKKAGGGSAGGSGGSKPKTVAELKKHWAKKPEPAPNVTSKEAPAPAAKTEPQEAPSPHPQSKPQMEMHQIATGPGEPSEKISQIQKVMEAYSVPSGGFAEKFGQQWIATLGAGVTEPAPAPKVTPTQTSQKPSEGTVTQTFGKQNLPPHSLNGVAFDHFDAPKTNQGWNQLAAKTKIDEPPFNIPKGESAGAGVIIQEPDGRVWVIHPTNAYGGYAATFPKGGVEKDMNLQSTAMKEAFEESGLKVELTGFAGDIKRTTSTARYYYAKRVGGTPVDAGWESENVTLAPVEDLHDILNVPTDKGMASKFLGASPKPPMKLSDMKKSGSQLGSNPGGKYTGPDGKQYYVKLSKSDSHAKNEHLAAKLYEAAGAPVLMPKLFDNNGKLATGTEWQSITPINRHDAKQRQAAQRNFAVHAWLANWDAAGLEYDNQGTAPNGKMTTLDPGGSLLYRAQGGPKGDAFGDKVTEWDTLRDPNNKQAHTIFGEMTPEDLAKSASRVAMVPDSIIKALVMEHGPGDDAAKKKLSARILARKQDIIARAKKLKKTHDGMTVDINYLDDDRSIRMELPHNWTEMDIRNALEAMVAQNNMKLYFGMVEPNPRRLGEMGPEAHPFEAPSDYFDDAAFEESKHPRDAGKFSTKSAPSGSPAQPALPEKGSSTAPKSKAAVPHPQPRRESTPRGGGREASKTAALQPAHHDREQWPEHIKSLKIPPAWSNVHHSMDPNAPLQATGHDVKGRKQYVYHPSFTSSQAEAKFAKIKELDNSFENIKTRNEQNRGHHDPKVAEHAHVMSLIMHTGIRPGGEGDTKAAKQAYGATTLKGRHIVQLQKGTRLRFTGKKGVGLDIPVNEPHLASMLHERAKAAGPGGDLFPRVSARSLLDYAHGLGGYTPKDFRTHLGTKSAVEHMKNIAPPTDEASYKKAVRAVANHVSTRLGNTPTVALQSYIHPAVFGEWRHKAGV